MSSAPSASPCSAFSRVPQAVHSPSPPPSSTPLRLSVSRFCFWAASWAASAWAFSRLSAVSISRNSIGAERPSRSPSMELALSSHACSLPACSRASAVSRLLSFRSLSKSSVSSCWVSRAFRLLPLPPRLSLALDFHSSFRLSPSKPSAPSPSKIAGLPSAPTTPSSISPSSSQAPSPASSSATPATTPSSSPAPPPSPYCFSWCDSPPALPFPPFPPPSPPPTHTKTIPPPPPPLFVPPPPSPPPRPPPHPPPPPPPPLPHGRNFRPRRQRTLP